MHAVGKDPELKRFYRRKLIQKGIGKARIAAARSSGPNQLLRRRVIHVEDQSSNHDGRTRRGAHTATPADTARAIGVPLCLLIERGLITDIKISIVPIRLGQALGRQFKSCAPLLLRAWN